MDVTPRPVVSLRGAKRRHLASTDFGQQSMQVSNLFMVEFEIAPGKYAVAITILFGG
jgi:hypothetical protein